MRVLILSVSPLPQDSTEPGIDRRPADLDEMERKSEERWQRRESVGDGRMKHSLNVIILQSPLTSILSRPRLMSSWLLERRATFPRLSDSPTLAIITVILFI